MRQTKPTRRRKKRRSRLDILRNIAIVVFVVSATVLILQRENDTGSRAFSTYYNHGNQGSDVDWSSEPLSGLESETQDALRGLADSERAVRKILENAEDYPASLLELLAKNQEALDFVENYPKQKDDTPPDTVGKVKKGEIPLLLQWDEQWGYTTYGTDFLAVTGCGPTCLSMVASGLTGDDTITPHRVAEYAQMNGYYVDGAGSAWSLMTDGCLNFGVWSRELPLDEGTMRNELAAGAPIVCSMLPGDFTEKGHFIVIVGAEEGGFRVHDPNSPDRSGKLWTYETLSTQIGNLWAFYPA